MNRIELEVNGKKYIVSHKPYDTLARVLREEIKLTGTKMGCDYGGCGACTVLVDKMTVYSCMYPVQYAAGKKIITVEGLANEKSNNRLSILQQSFLEHGGFQCGFCTPGILISASKLLEENSSPSLVDIQEALAGNICRCTGYRSIIDSILAAASHFKQENKLIGVK